MNQGTKKQIMSVMAFYYKKGIPYRAKQLKRLVAIFDDIFQHEPKLGERLNSVGKRQIIGYWERTKDESQAVRIEKYKILKLFFERCERKSKVPYPRAHANKR